MKVDKIKLVGYLTCDGGASERWGCHLKERDFRVCIVHLMERKEMSPLPLCCLALYHIP